MQAYHQTPTEAPAQAPQPSQHFGQQSFALSGIVKSWNGLKGFGFITSESVQGDVLFGRNELPEEAREVRGVFLEGRPVTFEAQEGADGRVKATAVQILPVEGRPLAGVIKSYSEKNSYGFVTSSSLSEDVRFHRTDLPGLVPGTNIKGQLVTFEMQALPDGKLRVSKLQFQSGKVAERLRGQAFPSMPPMMPAPAAYSFAYAPPAPQPAPQVGLGTLPGTVKSYSEKNGYGFINIPGQPVDIKFGRSDVAGGTIAAGTSVTFLLAIGQDGRVQAKQVTPVIQSLKRPANLLALPTAAALPSAGLATMGRAPKLQRTGPPAGVGTPTGQYGSGTIKSYNAAKGFGFISSPGTAGDIFFMRTALPPEVQGMNVQGQVVNFELVFAPDGKLRAQGISLA